MPSSARRWTQSDEAAAALMDQGRALGLSSVQAANRIAFVQQAIDAGSGLLGHVALQLAQDPRQAAVADTSREAMRALVREVERWAAPIQNTRRFAAEPLTLLGQPIEAGQAVLMVLASATATKHSTRSPTVLMYTVKLAGAWVLAPAPMPALALQLLLK